MNKFVLFLTIATINIASTVTEARDISKGTIMVTGDTSFDDSSLDFSFNGSTETTDTTEFNVTGAYFIAKNLGIGLMIANEDSDTSSGGTSINSSTNMIGPIIGYSISLNPDFNLMLSAGLYKISGDIDDGAGSNANFDGDGTLLMASLAYFINDTFAVNLGLRKIDSDIDLSTFGSSISISSTMKETAMNIGFTAFF